MKTYFMDLKILADRDLDGEVCSELENHGAKILSCCSYEDPACEGED